MCLAIPGEIMAVSDKHGMRFGVVSFAGVTREICLEYEPNAAVGDFVLVHVGFAIARIDRDEAARTWDALQTLAGDELRDELRQAEPHDGPGPDEAA